MKSQYKGQLLYNINKDKNTNEVKLRKHIKTSTFHLDSVYYLESRKPLKEVAYFIPWHKDTENNTDPSSPYMYKDFS